MSQGRLICVHTCRQHCMFPTRGFRASAPQLGVWLPLLFSPWPHLSLKMLRKIQLFQRDQGQIGSPSRLCVCVQPGAGSGTDPPSPPPCFISDSGDIPWTLHAWIYSPRKRGCREFMLKVITRLLKQQYFVTHAKGCAVVEAPHSPPDRLSVARQNLHGKNTSVETQECSF